MHTQTYTKDTHTHTRAASKKDTQFLERRVHRHLQLYSHVAHLCLQRLPALTVLRSLRLELFQSQTLDPELLPARQQKEQRSVIAGCETCVAGAVLPFPIPNHKLLYHLGSRPGVGWVVPGFSTAIHMKQGCSKAQHRCAMCSSRTCSFNCAMVRYSSSRSRAISPTLASSARTAAVVWVTTCSTSRFRDMTVLLIWRTRKQGDHGNALVSRSFKQQAFFVKLALHPHQSHLLLTHIGPQSLALRSSLRSALILNWPSLRSALTLHWPSLRSALTPHWPSLRPRPHTGPQSYRPSPRSPLRPHWPSGKSARTQIAPTPNRPSPFTGLH